jgi:hypothetical protein
MSCFSYIATLTSIIVYSYKTVIGLISGYSLSSGPFTSFTFTFIKLSCYFFTLATFYNNILLTRILLTRQ